MNTSTQIALPNPSEEKSRYLQTAFSPDGELLAAVTEQLNVFVWRVTTQEIVDKFSLHDNDKPTAMAWRKVGKELGIGYSSGRIRLCEISFDPSARYMTSFDTEMRNIVQMSFSTDDRCLLISDGTDWVEKWDIKQGKRIERTPCVRNYPEPLSDDIDLQMLWIPAGEFMMGSPESEEGRWENEGPQETVPVEGFWLGKYPVTVGQFRCFVKEKNYSTDAEKDDGAHVYDGENWKEKKDANWRNPYFEQDDDHPVVCVTWNDAKKFCDWLSEKTGETYTLPTEAQWEYACRAGSKARYSFGDDEKELDLHAWYGENSEKHTHPVGKKLPNRFDLHDMHGNAWEWCLTEFRDYPYQDDDGRNDPSGDKEKERVLRGGSWYVRPLSCRAAVRDGYHADFRNYSFGFRIARTQKP